MMPRIALVLFALLVAAQAAILPTQPTQLCPSNNGNFLLRFAGVGNTPGYLADVMFYNRAPNDLEWGTPLGPFFNFQEGSNCYYNLNNSLHCGLNLFTDSTYAQQIGTGRIDSDQMFTVTGSDGYTYVGGYVTVSTTITQMPAGAATNETLINFRSQSNVQVYFRPIRLFPDASTGQPPLANTLEMASNGTSGYLTLWGSDGWNGTDYVGAVRHTGFDIRARLECPPSQPSPCASGGNPASTFVIPSACIATSRTIRQTTNLNSLSMSFSQSDSTTAYSGCSNSASLP